MISLYELNKYHTIVDQVLIANYDDFLNALYLDLHKVILLIVEDRATAIKNEDNITAAIRRGLKQYKWMVSHDSEQGGHIDLYVELSDFKWKAEAKLNKGVESLTSAFSQIDVYADNYDKEMGFLIYNFNRNMDLSIEKFEEAAMTLSDYEIKFNDFCKTTYTNTSTFKHNSGNFMKIKYFWINLYHNQRTSKKKASD